MKAHIKFENRQNIEVILEKLKNISNINKNGELSFHTFDFQDIEWIFLSIIDFGNILNVESQKNILLKTLKEVVLKQRFDKSFFIDQLSNQIDIYNKNKVKTYCLLNTLSIVNLPFRKIKIGDSIIRNHGKKFPETFRKERNTLLKENNFTADNPVYTKVSIQIESKNYKDAYIDGFYNLEILRSFLCLLLNHSFEIRYGQRSRKPINRILRGETSTLHYLNGKSVDKNFFYFIYDYKKN